MPTASCHSSVRVLVRGSLAVLALLTVGPRLFADELTTAMREASRRYADALNAGDMAAVGDHWTVNAALTEGGGTIRGRERIVESLKKWRDRHPKSMLGIDVTGIEPLGETAVRVHGRLLFTPAPGEKPHGSRFESLRVAENGTWRIAESRVGPSAGALMHDLAWLLGTWQATDARTGTSFEMRFEKALDGRAILGRSTIRPKQGSPVEAIDLIHADARDGLVRCWILDSTGARAEGVLDSDGTSLNRSLVGVAGEEAGSGRVQWVQVIAPGAGDRMVLHAIDRAVDGRPVPDGEPVTFRRIR